MNFAISLFIIIRGKSVLHKPDVRRCSFPAELINVSIVCDSLLIAEGLQRLVESDDIRCFLPSRLEQEKILGVVVFVVGSNLLARVALRRFLDLHPAARLLVLGIWLQSDFGSIFRDEGALGFMDQRATRLQLLEAIRTVDRGGLYFTGDFQSGARSRKRPPLSVRETEILARIRTGKSPKAIAHELRISAKTVSTYRRRLLDKLGLETNAELITLDLDTEDAHRQ